jgi:hypothetical protein
MASPVYAELPPPPDYAVADCLGYPRNAWLAEDDTTKPSTCPEPPPYQPQQQRYNNLFCVDPAGIVPPLTPSSSSPIPLALGPLHAGYYPVTQPNSPPPQYMGYLPAYDQIVSGQQQVVMIANSHPPVHLHSVESFAIQLALSCFVLCFCNVLFGLVAFVLAGE